MTTRYDQMLPLIAGAPQERLALVQKSRSLNKKSGTQSGIRRPPHLLRPRRRRTCAMCRQDVGMNDQLELHLELVKAVRKGRVIVTLV